jgi:Zn-dependent peptidase ImmA (M78 family)/DNA-binding XRE family transcriptional regulator
MIGNRIKLARDAYGWSLRDLEERIEGLVSAQAIGKYERNEMMPSSKVLLALAKALGVTPDFLLSEKEISLESIDFRKVPASGARDERSVQAQVLDAAERYLELESYFPDTAIVWQPPQALEFQIRKIEDAEAAAEKLRHLWKLGIDPIASVTELLEDQGIKVLPLSLPEVVSGSKAFARPTGGNAVAMIVVNQNHNGERQRFTLAHELGHLVLNCGDLSDRENEKAADWFAGAFLVARKMVEKILGRSRTAITFGELESVKAIFKVSLASLVVRLKQLGIVPKALYEELWGAIKARGLNAAGAPEPNPIPPETPNRALRLAFRAVAEGAISESKAAELLRIGRHELQRLLDPDLGVKVA